MEEELNKTKTLLNKQNNMKVNINNSNLTESRTQEGNKTYNLEEIEKGRKKGEDSAIKIKKINELYEKVKRYKSEGKFFREKWQKDSAELNKKYLERNKFENIFNDCVKETKKLIYNRKLKDHKSYKIKNKTGLGKYDYKVNFTTKYDEFLPGDKQSTLENFLFNEEVYNLVKDAIFKHPGRNNKKFDKAKFNLSEQDWKMQEIMQNASSDFTKNDMFLPLMSVGNQKDNNMKSQSKEQSKLYKTGRINIKNPLLTKNPHLLGTSTKFSMNLQI